LRAFSGQQWDGLWTFAQVDGVEPTNNAAERALRPGVLWRKGCFGTHRQQPFHKPAADGACHVSATRQTSVILPDRGGGSLLVGSACAHAGGGLNGYAIYPLEVNFLPRKSAYVRCLNAM
jgi:hypothetical protein